MGTIRKWWPSIMAAIVAVLGTFEPSIQVYVSAHPAIAVALAALATILAHISPSPKS